VPLDQLASIHFAMGPDMVRSEAGQVSGFVFVDVAERPIVDYVRDARRAVAERVQLPPGVRIEWAGQFQAYERARDRLYIVVPLTLLLVSLLLYGTPAGRRDRDDPARGAVLPGRRRLAALRARLQPLGCGLGRDHRARGSRRADGRRDAVYLSVAWRDGESGRLRDGDLEERSSKGRRAVRPKR
jgi:hypothetical protein